MTMTTNTTDGGVQMTGGSNVDVAFVHEPVGDYAGSPMDSEYKTPGGTAR